LAQRCYESAHHRALDWLTGNRSVLIQPGEPLPEGFRPNVEAVPVPPAPGRDLEKIPLKGFIRGTDDWENHFDPRIFHQQLRSFLREGASDGAFVMRTTALAFFLALKNREERPKCWAFREIETARASLYTPVVRRQNHFLEAFLDWFPRAEVLMQVRDPRAVTLSRRDHAAAKRPPHPLDNRAYLFEDAFIVSQSLHQTEAHVRSSHGDRIHLIHYEDLVDNPEATMSDIASRLRLKAADIWLKPTVLGLPNQVITAKSFDGTRVDTSRKERWRGEFRGKTLLMLESMLWNGKTFSGSALGYEPQNTKAVLRLMHKFVLPRFLEKITTGHALPYALRRPFRFYGLTGKRNKADPRAIANDAKTLAATRNELRNRLIYRGLRCPGRVLDIGGEHGLWALALAEHAASVDTVINDPSEADFWRDLYRSENITNIEVISRLPGPDKGYDLVHVREYRSEKPLQEQIDRFAGIVRPGGRLYVTAPGYGMRWLKKNRDIRVVSKRQFHRALEKAGLRLEYTGFAYASIDREPLPARFGPWYRELDALAVRPGKYGGSWS
jgi:hypothetical protein